MLARLRLTALIGITLGLLSACSTGLIGNSLGNLPQSSSASTEELLRQADSSAPAQAAELRLAAADRAIGNQDFARAQGILRQVPQTLLPPAQQIFAATLNAEIALHQSNYQGALNALNINAIQRLDELPIQQQVRTHLAHSRAFAGNRQNLAAARERAFIGPLLSGSAAEQNKEAIWQLVSALPAQQLQPTGDSDLDGWLALAGALRRSGSLAQQQRAIEDWIATYPNHPAATQLPDTLEKLRHLSSQPIRKIGLLLPQHGQLASAAQALRDGFVSASFVNSDRGGAPQVAFYDSTQIGSLDSFYAKAQAEGVQLVVGPLEKPLVRQLSLRQRLPITTLSLNYSDAASPPPQLFQYGLSPEDEARQIARRALGEGKRRAIALVPEGEWGTRVLTAFQNNWQPAGGTLVGAKRIASPEAISSQLAELLQVNNQEHRRRQDVDFLFLAATPQQARLIKPVLEYQYAGDLPVYATSNVYSGTPAPDQDGDLEGIQFCDTPWLFNTGDPLRIQITQQWPQANGGIGRLYAMGADAFRLTQQLPQMQAVPGSGFDGLSGNLTLDATRRIQRALPWAEFRGGLATPLPVGQSGF